MFSRLFGGAARSRRIIVDALYEKIVAAARQPVFYSDWKVPDTPLGRFEMLALHMFLLLHRIRLEDGAAREIGQALTDEFFRDVEHSLRELGIGDLGVPKRMKKLARMFYGRAAAYGDAIDRDDRQAFAAALRRNVMPGVEDWPGADALADHALASYRHLSATPSEALREGGLSFPDPAKDTPR